MTTEEPWSTPPHTLECCRSERRTRRAAFCSFSNRGEGLRLLAPGCSLDGAEPTTGAPNYNYWQGTSEASAIAAAALDALDSYQPGLSPKATKDLTEADNGVLDIAQTFRRWARSDRQGRRSGRAGGTVELDAGIVSAAGGTIGRDEAHAAIRTPASPAEASQAPPGARLVGTPERIAGAGPLPRPQGTITPTGGGLRTLRGVFTSLTLPASGVVEVSVRYTDPYDVERASPWTTLRLPASESTAGKAKRGG